MTEQAFIVSGMTCNHCVSSVSAELNKIPSVENVEIDLETGRVTIQADHVTHDQIRAAIDEAGYAVV